MVERDSMINKLISLRLPEGSYMVMGSGILDVLDIRRAVDVDLVVSEEVYVYLWEDGWNERVASNGAVGIERDVFQAYAKWDDEGTIKTLNELLVDAEWVNGVAYNSLAKLTLYKVRRGREKDLADLELINKYLELQ